MDVISRVSWFKKYQPKTIDEYVFESENVKNEVVTWVENGFIPGNVLLHGEAGTGKSALAYLIIHGIIKNQYDLKKVKDKKAATMDSLLTWIQKAPVKSKQKIIYIEEFDRCSNEAFNTLKDGLMENYQEHVSFICTTNHLRRVEHAIQTRFIYRYNLNSSNLAGTYERLSTILNAENVEWTVEGLKHYVETNIKIGLRELINGLQNNVRDGKIDFFNIKLEKSEQENSLITNTLSLFGTLLQSTDMNDKILALKMPMKSSIASYWSSINELILYNYEINYESVFLEIQESNTFGPLLPIIDNYISTMSMKKFPHVHYQAFLYDAMKCIVEINI